jgi:hypothetical protein
VLHPSSCHVHANIDIECLYLSLYHCNALVYENKESKESIYHKDNCCIVVAVLFNVYRDHHLLFLRLLYPMLPFLISPSVFSNVYLLL